MRVEKESSLRLVVAGRPLHLIVGASRSDGTIACRLLGVPPEHHAFVVVFDLSGHLVGAEAAGPAHEAASVLSALKKVDPAQWRNGLARGLRRRLSVLEDLDVEGFSVVQDLAQLVAREHARLAALESDDSALQLVLAELARHWSGSVDGLLGAARRVLDN